MTNDTAEFRVSVEGSPKAIDQFEHLLHKISQEGERGNVDVDIERIETTDIDDSELEFS